MRTGLALGILALIFGSVGMLALRARGWHLGAADMGAIWFTLKQAALSAAIATALAIPLSRALFRRRFWGREGLIAAMSAPFVLPVLVAVLGLLAIFGRAGPVNAALAALGLPGISIFGLQGILLANVFFNLPLATRLLLLAWQAIPAERFLLAQSLNLGLRHIQGPMLRAQVPGIMAAIFLICLSSFTIALSLGGGPKSSTIELAIYQALRFDFDLGRAAILALVQFALCLVVAVFSGADSGQGLRRLAPALPGGVLDYPLIGLAAAFLLAPIAAAVWQGMGGLAHLPDAVWPALLRSVLVAGAATVLAVGMALVLAFDPRRWVELAAMLPLATSGLVLGTGLFLLLRPMVTPGAIALPLTVLTNALMALPFLYRIFAPQARRLVLTQGRLIAALDLTRGTTWRMILMPQMGRSIGYGAGVAAALSMGDLGVIALFADDQTATLPLLIQRLMAAYQMQAASGVALVLIAISGGMFFALDLGGRRYAGA